MFSFMKKDKEKDKEKKEKNEKKKREKDERKERVKKERQNMTVEEISRLEEMKKGLLRRFSDKDKKRWSFKTFHSASLPENEAAGEATLAPSNMSKEDRPLADCRSLPGYQGSVSDAKKALPPSAVKSILKGKNEVQHQHETVNLDDSKLLQENTRRNKEILMNQTLDTGIAAASTQQIKSLDVSIEKQHMKHMSSLLTTSEVQSSATDSVPKDDDVNEEDKNLSNLPLPAIIPPKPPRIREVQVHRLQSGGFGFSLRKSVIPQQGDGPPKVITFAEPGNGPNSVRIGLLPGDRLIEVNGQNVETKSREDIAEIIKQSADSLILKVQPILELIELSVRPNRDGTSTDLPEDAARTGTLRRSGSLRYKPR
ncbi:unnamed protein product, partial [Candidula unifasciata]